MSSDNGPTGIWAWACRLKVRIRRQLCVLFVLSVLPWHWTGHIKYIVVVPFVSSVRCTLSLFSQHLPPQQKPEVLVLTGSVLRTYWVFKHTFLQAVLKWVGQIRMRVKAEIDPKVSISNNPKSKPSTLSNHLPNGVHPSRQIPTPCTTTDSGPSTPTLIIFNHFILSHQAQIEQYNRFQYGASSSHS